MASIPASRILVSPELEAVLMPALGPLAGASTSEITRIHGGGHTRQTADLVILASTPSRPISGAEVIAMPGVSANRCDSPIIHELAISEHRMPVVMVPGFTDASGSPINPTSMSRLSVGLDLAEVLAASAVVLSGWRGWSARTLCLTEAFQMRSLVHNSKLPILMDTAARTTAENIACFRDLVRGLGGVSRGVVVASWSNALRTQVLADGLWGNDDGELPPVSVHVAWGASHGASLRAGLVGLYWARRHRRAAEALLDFGPFDLRARP